MGKRSPNKRMDYSYYDEDEEERRWGRGSLVQQPDRQTLQERMRMQRAITMGNMGRGSDSRNGFVQDHLMLDLRRSVYIDLNEEDFRSRS